MNKETNTLSTSKKLLPYIITGALVLVFLLGLLLTLNPKNRGQTISNLPAYPTAQPQLFANSSDQFGALVVTSQQKEISITIDEKEVKDQSFFPYSNTPPFVVPRIPIGNHVLRAHKEGFLTSALNIEIKNNQISTIDISLAPNPNPQNLKKAEAKMPIVTNEYTIEYLNYIGVVQVNINLAPFEQNKQKAIQWFKDQGIIDPEAQGVQFNDLTKIYVH